MQLQPQVLHHPLQQLGQGLPACQGVGLAIDHGLGECGTATAGQRLAPRGADELKNAVGIEQDGAHGSG